MLHAPHLALVATERAADGLLLVGGQLLEALSVLLLREGRAAERVVHQRRVVMWGKQRCMMIHEVISRDLRVRGAGNLLH